MRQIITIQYLRAIAAILVVIYHHTNNHRDLYAPDLMSFHFGAFGVDVFFVISGFIMWMVSSARPTTPARFMQNRIIRIVPIYWALTLVTAFLSTDGGVHISLDQDILKLIKSLLFIPEWNAEFPDIVAPVMLVGWTLNLEMLFYVVFSLALFLPSRTRLIAICAVLFVLGTAQLWLDAGASPVLNLYTMTVVLEFGFGMLLAQAYLRSDGAVFDTPKGWVIALVLCMGAICFLVIKDHLVDVRAIYWGLPALMLVAGCLYLDRVARTRPIKWFGFLGDASYSIYLSHIMTMAISQKVVGYTMNTQQPYLALIAQIAMALVVGGVIYLLVEKPLTKGMRRMVIRRRGQAT